MAFTFQQAATNSATGTSLAVTFANAPVSGELIVATVATNSSTATVTPPSGFSTKVSNANTSRSIGIYWKIAGGSESTSYTWGFSASITSAVVMRRFSSDYGWNTDQSGGASGYTWDSASVSSVSMSITTTANRLVVGDGYSSNTTSTNKQLNPNSNWLDNTLLYSSRTRSAYRTATGGSETFGYQLTDSAVDTRLAIMAAEFVEYTTPTLSSINPSGTIGTQTTATVGATTDTVSGTFYYVLSATQGHITGVTAAQIKAGNNSSGTAAQKSGSSSVVSSTPSVSVTGLTANTTYYYAVVQNTTAGDSNVISSGVFSTAAAPVTSNERNIHQAIIQPIYKPIGRAI